MFEAAHGMFTRVQCCCRETGFVPDFVDKRAVLFKGRCVKRNVGLGGQVSELVEAGIWGGLGIAGTAVSWKTRV
jgi:hypothetical protein